MGRKLAELINERALAAYPNIGEDKAKDVDTFIREARNDIFKIIEQCYLKELTETQAKSKTQEKYPFLNDDNFKRLFSQGMYYAWKDNG